MSQKQLTKTDILLIVLGVVTIGVVLFFAVSDVHLSSDTQIDAIAKDVVQRGVLALFLVTMCATSGHRTVLAFPTTNMRRQLLCLLPCLAVAVANFPFSALSSGAAVVEKTQYVWLFLIQCVLIGVVEEVFFRGIAQQIVFDKLAQKHLVWRVVTAAAVFALWHLVNLLFGAGIGTTLLQVGYSFLIGAMLSVLMYATRNIWWCVAVHALFDVGGTVVSSLGKGNPWDTPFWIATVVCGTICAVWCVYMVFCVLRDTEQACETIETQAQDKTGNDVENQSRT